MTQLFVSVKEVLEGIFRSNSSSSISSSHGRGQAWDKSLDHIPSNPPAASHSCRTASYDSSGPGTTVPCAMPLAPLAPVSTDSDAAPLISVGAATSSSNPMPPHGRSCESASTTGATCSQQAAPEFSRGSLASMNEANSAAGKALRQSSVSNRKGDFTRDNLVAYMRWVRATRGVMKLRRPHSVSNFRSPSPQLLLRCEHWLEVTDTQHRYGSNLRVYFDFWVAEMEAAELTPPPSPALMSPSPSCPQLTALVQSGGACLQAPIPVPRPVQMERAASQGLPPVQEAADGINTLSSSYGAMGHHYHGQHMGRTAERSAPALSRMSCSPGISGKGLGLAAHEYPDASGDLPPGEPLDQGGRSVRISSCATAVLRNGDDTVDDADSAPSSMRSSMDAGERIPGQGPSTRGKDCSWSSQQPEHLQHLRRHSSGNTPDQQAWQQVSAARVSASAVLAVPAASVELSPSCCGAASISAPCGQPALKAPRNGQQQEHVSSSNGAIRAAASPFAPAVGTMAKSYGPSACRPASATLSTTGCAGAPPGAASAAAGMASVASNVIALRAAKLLASRNCVSNGTSFFRWLDHGPGLHVDLAHLGVPRHKLDLERVVYLTPSELLEYELDVDVDTGLLRYKRSGKPLHTGHGGRSSLDEERRPPTPPPPAVPLALLGAGAAPWLRSDSMLATDPGEASTSGAEGRIQGRQRVAGVYDAARQVLDFGAEPRAKSVSFAVCSHAQASVAESDRTQHQLRSCPTASGSSAEHEVTGMLPSTCGAMQGSGVGGMICAPVATRSVPTSSAAGPASMRNSSPGTWAGVATAPFCAFDATAKAAACGLGGIKDESSGHAGAPDDETRVWSSFSISIGAGTSLAAEADSSCGGSPGRHAPPPCKASGSATVVEAECAAACSVAGAHAVQSCSPLLPALVSTQAQVAGVKASSTVSGGAHPIAPSVGLKHPAAAEEKVAKWIYVVDPELRMFAHPKVRGRFHHSSFLCGGAVVAAGGLAARHGQLRLLTADSGHYWPRSENFRWLCEHLVSVGADLSACELRSKHTEVPAGTGRELMERLQQSTPSASHEGSDA